MPPVIVACAAVLVLVLLVWRVVQHYQAEAAAAAAASAPRSGNRLPPAPAAASRPAPATPSPKAEAPAPPPAIAQRPPPPSLPAAVTLPYRYMGNTGSGPDAELVFFGRGRTVTLRGPGPLDDEYVVESIGDQRLQWRHLPTGTSQFIAMEVRPAAAQAAAAKPEDYPRD